MCRNIKTLFNFDPPVTKEEVRAASLQFGETRGQTGRSPNFHGNYTYTWDGESQIKTAGGVTYSYDGDGRRAAKVGSKLYWYGSGGEILSETDTAGNVQNEYVFFGGKRVALMLSNGDKRYYVEDSLGSSRVVAGTGAVCYDADFPPFGQERAYTNTCSQNYKFEGKERDTETQNDDFGAREYSWRFGRWLSSDWSSVPVPVPYANLTNPQTLNLYSMVADDPESFADLDGHLTQVCSNAGQCGTMDDNSFDSEESQAQKNGEYFQNGQMFHFDTDGNKVTDGTYAWQGPDLNPFALGVARSVGDRVPAIYKGMAIFEGGSFLVGTGLWATGAVDALAIAPEINSVLGPSRAVNMLMKVTDPKLRNIIKAMYRVNAEVGDGGTADAVRYTKETGDLVGGSDHIQSAGDLSRGLQNALKNPGLSAAERSIARTLLNELTNALK